MRGTELFAFTHLVIEKESLERFQNTSTTCVKAQRLLDTWALTVLDIKFDMP